MNTWRQTLDWYKTHQFAREIGFNPDGQCLRVCRTARAIGAVYPSAKAAQDATPEKYRVKKIRDLRRGMVLYFDDPNDSNKFGHIVTMIGRVKGFDWDSLDDVLVETNSVKSGELVVVRATYFKEHWGDSFQFGATWLNGQELDIPVKKKPKPAAKPETTRLENFWASRPEWDVNILDRANRAEGNEAIKKVERAVRDLPNDKDDSRVKEFKKRFREDRVLDMRLLNKAVAEGREGQVKKSRDQINAALKKLPRR